MCLRCVYCPLFFPFVSTLKHVIPFLVCFLLDLTNIVTCAFTVISPFDSTNMSVDQSTSSRLSAVNDRKYTSSDEAQGSISMVSPEEIEADKKLHSRPNSATKWFVNNYRHLILVRQLAYRPHVQLNFGEITNIRTKLDPYTEKPLHHITCTTFHPHRATKKVKIWLFSSCFLPQMCPSDFSNITLDQVQTLGEAQQQAGKAF